MSYAIYLRKSRADMEAEARGEGETLSRHKTTLLAVAKQKNLEIGAIYEELVSGETIAARPKMQQLLAEVEAGQWQGVLVMEVERLARGDSIDQGIVTQAFKYSGTIIVTPAKVYDPQNEFDEEYFEFGLFMSRREYQTIKRRMVAGRIASVKEGKYMGKTDPYGYYRVPVKEGKGYTLSINTEEAPIVKEVFVLRHAGQGSHLIAKHLNARKLKTKAGISWSAQSVSTLLRNPLYAGFVTWGRKKAFPTVTNGVIKKPRKYTDDYVKVKGLHEPLITEDLFNEVQQIIKDTPSLPVKKHHEQKNPFIGLLHCAQCGHVMRLGFTKRKTNSAGRLFCKWVDCSCVGCYCEEVEEAVLESLRLWMAEYNVDVSQASNLNEEHERDLAQAQSEVAVLTGELTLQHKQLEKASELVEQGVYTPEHFVSRQTQLNARIQQIEDNLATAKERLKSVQLQANSAAIMLPKLQHVLEAYETASNAQEKNDLLRSVISRIDYNKTGFVRDKSADSNIYLNITRRFDAEI